MRTWERLEQECKHLVLPEQRLGKLRQRVGKLKQQVDKLVGQFERPLKALTVSLYRLRLVQQLAERVQPRRLVEQVQPQQLEQLVERVQLQQLAERVQPR